jgi:CsoR family transcriptional regulator, copper-sensing transcriptional repressor
MRQIYPSHDEQLERLSKIEGQIKGVRRMIEERRYCIDIVSQMKAVEAALKQVQLGVIKKHVHHCVTEAMHSKEPAYLEEKVEELVKVMGRMA